LQGQTFLFAGQYERAIESLNKTFEIDPNFWVGHIQLARVFIQQNDFERAIAEAEKAKQFSGGNSEAISLAGYAHAKAGRPEKARQALALLIAMRTQGRITNYNAAMVYNALGRPDEALAELQQAVDNRDVRLILLRVDPKWDNLRNDQRFILIQERLNFE
jgi:Flp pilus assembly protein TadD